MHEHDHADLARAQTVLRQVARKNHVVHKTGYGLGKVQ